MFGGLYGADAKKFAQEDGARLDAARAAAKGAFYDEADSDKFKSDLDKRIADIGARRGAGEATAQKTTFGPAAYATAARAAPAATMTGAVIARPDAAAREEQAAILNQYLAGMAGKGPSIANQQMQQSTDAGLAAMMRARAAKGARVNPALAGLAGNAALGGALHEGQLLSASTKAREVNEAAQKFGALSSAVRGQDIDAATAQAKMNQEAALFSANAQNANALANKGFADQTSAFNASAAVKQAQMQQQVELANMEADLRARGMNDAQIAHLLAQKQAQFNLDKDARIAFEEYKRQQSNFDAKMTFDRNRAQDARNAATYSAIASMIPLVGSAAASAATSDTNAKYDSGPKTTSDARAKKDIKPGGSSLTSLLDSLDAYDYEYKEPHKPGRAPGRHVSVMAQDLEKTDLGKSAVSTDAEGTKMVDSGRLASLSFAALVDMHKRLKAVEKRKGK